MSVCTTWAADVIGAEPHLAMLPKAYKANGTVPGIIYCHGSGSSEAQPLDQVNFPTLTALLRNIGENYPIVSSLLGGNAWANDTALTRIGQVRTYLQGPLGAKAGKVILIGGSMGGATAYAWARANPTLVSCLVQLQPVSDIQDIVANNRQGLAAQVNAAYGGAYSNATHGPTHNPESFKAQLAGLRAQVWYSTEDTTVIPATVTSVTTAIGATADPRPIPGTHSDAGIAGIDINAVLQHLASYGWS